MFEKLLENPEIYRIEVPLPGSPLKALNSYLIRSEGDELLVDTGFRNPESIAALSQALDELGIDRFRMRIFLTHLHTDHIGSVLDIAEPMTVIYMSETDFNIHYEFTVEEKWHETDRKYLSEGYPEEELREVRGTNPLRTYRPQDLFVPTFVHGGSELWVGNTRCQFVSVPGHTPGHMCLWLPKQGAMILGDHVLFNISPNITCWPDVKDSLGNYLESLDKIAAYPVTLPLPGHRGVTMTMQERVEELKAHHGRRLERMTREVHDNPGMTAYEVASRSVWHMHGKKWDEAPRSQKWFAVGETIAHLDYLRLRGAIYRTNEDGIWHYYR